VNVRGWGMKYQLRLIGTVEEALDAVAESMGEAEALGHYAAHHGRTEYVGERAVDILADLYLALTGEPWPGADK